MLLPGCFSEAYRCHASDDCRVLDTTPLFSDGYEWQARDSRGLVTVPAEVQRHDPWNGGEGRARLSVSADAPPQLVALDLFGVRRLELRSSGSWAVGSAPGESGGAAREVDPAGLDEPAGRGAPLPEAPWGALIAVFAPSEPGTPMRPPVLLGSERDIVFHPQYRPGELGGDGPIESRPYLNETSEFLCLTVNVPRGDTRTRRGTLDVRLRWRRGD